jgi:hypothetical protein
MATQLFPLSHAIRCDVDSCILILGHLCEHRSENGGPKPGSWVGRKRKIARISMEDIPVI